MTFHEKTEYELAEKKQELKRKSGNKRRKEHRNYFRVITDRI